VFLNEHKLTHFLSKKVTPFFVPRITEFHFYLGVESPAYISGNRVGNFFYIEKRYLFQKNSIKFMTRFPERYLERRIHLRCMIVQRFFMKESIQKNKFAKAFSKSF
jgi:hypothetical protein